MKDQLQINENQWTASEINENQCTSMKTDWKSTETFKYIKNNENRIKRHNIIKNLTEIIENHWNKQTKKQLDGNQWKSNEKRLKTDGRSIDN